MNSSPKPTKGNCFLLSSIWLLLFFQAAAAPVEPIERITRNDLKVMKDGMPGEEMLHRQVVVATGVELTAEIEVTAKGNGYLRIDNLNLKVFDSNDDGVYYENGLLNIDFADIDGDGKRELVISGIVCLTDEKGKTVLRREAVTFIYRLQRDSHFVLAYSNADFRLEQ